MNGELFPCDVGLFNERHFVYVAAFGAFTEVSYSTPQQFKNALGRAAYILEGIKHLAEIKSYQMTVEHNGEQIHGEFIFGMVSNSTSVGGFKMNNKANVSMNEGLLEVLLVKKPRNPIELQNAIGALLLNDLTMSVCICFTPVSCAFTPTRRYPGRWTASLAAACRMCIFRLNIKRMKLWCQKAKRKKNRKQLPL